MLFRAAPIAVLALFLLGTAALVQVGFSDPIHAAPDPAAAPDAPESSLDSVEPDGEAALETSSCYLPCVQSCIADMCTGLPPEFLQDCSFACAEGCRCMCGLPCP